MSAHYPVIYSARAMHRILTNACLAGEDIDEMEKKYLHRSQTAHDLIEIQPEDEDRLHSWDVQHTTVRSYPNPTSAEHHRAMIAATPHHSATAKKRSNRISINGGDTSTPSPRLPSAPAKFPPHRGFSSSSQTYLPSVLRLLAEPLRKLFERDVYRAYTKERTDFEALPDRYREDNIQALLDLPLAFGSALQGCWQRGATPVVLDKLAGLVDTLPSIQQQSIGLFVESLLESLTMTFKPFVPRIAPSAATMSQVPESQATTYHQHAASRLTTMFAGLYCEGSTCSECGRNDAAYKTALVLTLKTQAYEMDVQEQFARLLTTRHTCSFSAELTHTFMALAAPLLIIVAFDHHTKVAYPTDDLLVTVAEGERVVYDLIGVCNAVDSPSSKMHEVWFAAGGVWFRQDGNGTIAKEPDIESSKPSHPPVLLYKRNFGK